MTLKPQVSTSSTLRYILRGGARVLGSVKWESRGVSEPLGLNVRLVAKGEGVTVGMGLTRGSPGPTGVQSSGDSWSNAL